MKLIGFGFMEEFEVDFVIFEIYKLIFEIHRNQLIYEKY